MVIKDDKILLGKNKNWYGTGNFEMLGGHLEFGESFEACIKREMAEECGLEIGNIKFSAVANILDDSKKQEELHNVALLFTADYKSGEPKVLEPEKVEFWDWYDLENLPKPLFRNVELSIEAFKSGKNYFDILK